MDLQSFIIFYYFSSTATFAKTGYNSDNFPEQIKINITYIENHSLRFPFYIMI